MPADLRAQVASALQLDFSESARTRDGAFVLVLGTPVPIDTARAAINRMRLLPDVLYANLNQPKAADAERNSVQRKAAPILPPVTRLIVKYRDAAVTQGAVRGNPIPPGLLNRAAAAAGHALAHERSMSGGAYVLRLLQPVTQDVAMAIATVLERDPDVEYADPDLLKQPYATPNDPMFGSQWDFKGPPSEPGGINLPAAWDITTGSAIVVVSIIDTGYLPHPDLTGRIIGGYDFISDVQIANDGNGRDADPADPGDWITAAESASGYFQGCPTSNSSWHGTHVAGTIGATTNNGVGVAGISVSNMLSARVLGKCGGYTSDIADAIRWSVGLAVPGVPANANPAKVLNLSLGGNACDSSGQNCKCDTTSQSAINAALAAGAVVVVAAGNSNADAITSSPGNCSGVITVAATGRAGQRASYSNYGALIEIAAPGGADGNYILSTLNSGTTSPDPNGYNYAWYQGTSMATPHVSGVASLMFSVNPSLTPAQLIAKMQSTARPFPSGTGRDCNTSLCGAGIIDAAAAVSASLLGPASTTTTVASSANPSIAGTGVTFTAAVSGSAPTGTVAFTSDSSTLAGCASVSLTGGGNAPSATCSTSALTVGTHSIVATYNGDSSNAGSASAALSQVVNSTSALSNLGFETPNVGSGGYQYGPAGAGWTFTGGGGISGNGSAFTSGNPAAPQGTQVAFLQNSGSISQTANIAAGQYTLSFKAAQRGNYQNGTQLVQVKIDGVLVGQYQPPSTSYSSYQTPPFSIASTGSHTISLSSAGSGSDYTGFIDDVQLAP